MANQGRGMEAFGKAKEKRLAAKAADHPVLVGGAVLVGAGLAYAAYKALKNSERDDIAKAVHIEASIAINKSPAELYAYWRDFRNLPLFMNNLVSVSPFDRTRSHWIARGIAGSNIEWDAEIFNEIEDQLIAWRSLEDSDVVNAGSVRFQKGPEGHGTFLRVTMNYNPPAGRVGDALAQVVGSSPAQLIKEDLRRLKQMLEAGEIASVVGQSSGRAKHAFEVE